MATAWHWMPAISTLQQQTVSLDLKDGCAGCDGCSQQWLLVAVVLSAVCTCTAGMWVCTWPSPHWSLCWLTCTQVVSCCASAARTMCVTSPQAHPPTRLSSMGWMTTCLPQKVSDGGNAAVAVVVIPPALLQTAIREGCRGYRLDSTGVPPTRQVCRQGLPTKLSIMRSIAQLQPVPLTENLWLLLPTLQLKACSPTIRMQAVTQHTAPP